MYILLGIIVLFVIAYFVFTQRRLVCLDEKALNALAQIGVLLQNRLGAVKALVQLVERYSIQEHITLMDVVENRSTLGDKVTPQQINMDKNLLSGVLGHIVALSEAYPNLKDNDVYQKAIRGVTNYEENVRMSRMIYNDTVTSINSLVRRWPSSIVADFMSFNIRHYLNTSDKRTF